MKKALILLALVAGCGAADAPSNGGMTVEPATKGPVVTGAARSRQSEASLVGLYEGGDAARPDQLCVVDKGAKPQFGLVVWGANMHSCSGSGEAVRDGERLRLAMAGDETCAIEATIANGTITLPATLPAGCSYYCGARADMSGAAFLQKGTSTEDALKARDLAGDPLCGEVR